MKAFAFVAAVLGVLIAATPPARAQEDSFEENDTLGTSTAVGYGVYPAYGADDDWFRIPNVQPGTFFVDVEPALAGQLGSFLKDASGTPLFANPSQRVFQFLSPIDLTVHVLKTGVSSSHYTLTVSDHIDVPGDDAYDAGSGNDNVLGAPLVASTSQLIGMESKDLDFYAVDVLPGVFTLSVTPDAGLVDLELYDSTGARICSYEGNACRYSVTGGLGLRYEVQNAERLTVGVIPARNFQVPASGPTYTLTLDLPTKWITTLDSGPVRFGSVTLADVDRDGTEEILVGSSKGLDGALNEVVPAALVCLRSDGTVRWSTPFPAIAGPDPFSGKTYATTSVSSTPAVGDIDGDGDLEVVVGVGADLGGEAELCCGAAVSEVPGQPGDLGGVYAVDAKTGAIEWFHQSLDRIGGPANTGDGRPEGVFSTPLLADVDGVPGVEVIFGGWDQYVWALHGDDGSTLWSTFVFDTVFSSPTLSDLDGNGAQDILIGGDVTENAASGTQTGGIFHVFRPDGSQTVPGFDQRINPGQPLADPIYGKFEDQVLASSPAVANFAGDAFPEIAYGTGFFVAGAGKYVRVWNHDGTPLYQFTTRGQTWASPVFADLDGDGDIELVAGDSAGWLYAWNGNGTLAWETRTFPWCGGQACDADILSSPLAVDLDGDGDLEILYAQGFQIVVVDSDGTQLSSDTVPFMALGGSRGSPAVGDIDGDGVTEIVAAGNLFTNSAEKATIFVWRWEQGSAPLGRFARRQFRAVPEADAMLGALASAATLAVLARGRFRRGAVCTRVASWLGADSP